MTAQKIGPYRVMDRAARGGRAAAPAAAVALLAALITGGCGAPGDDAPEVVREQSRTEEVIPSLPESDERTLHAAQMELVARCMEDAGFDFERTSFDEIKASDDRAVARAAGVSRRDEVEKDHSLAAKIGWGIDPGPAPEPEPVEDVQPPPGPDERARQQALFGTRYTKVRTAQGSVLEYPTDGCQASADRRLYGDVGAWNVSTFHVTNLDSVVGSVVDRRSDVRTVTRAWRRCVKDATGEAVKDPDGAYARALEWNADGEPDAKGREIALATAVYDCDDEHRYTPVVDAAWRTELRREKYAPNGLIVRYLELRSRGLREARAVLDE